MSGPRVKALSVVELDRINQMSADRAQRVSDVLAKAAVLAADHYREERLAVQECQCCFYLVKRPEVVRLPEVLDYAKQLALELAHDPEVAFERIDVDTDFTSAQPLEYIHLVLRFPDTDKTVELPQLDPKELEWNE